MASEYPESANRHPNSRSHASRPTTPLRPSSRSSFRDSARSAGNGEGSFPLAAFEPAFSELSDAVADLEANMMHFQLMHESLSRFSESFASFLYGLNMNAFCVDFPEGPVLESFRRDRQQEDPAVDAPQPDNCETTFLQARPNKLETVQTLRPVVLIIEAAQRAPRSSRIPRHRQNPSRGPKLASHVCLLPGIPRLGENPMLPAVAVGRVDSRVPEPKESGEERSGRSFLLQRFTQVPESPQSYDD